MRIDVSGILGGDEQPVYVLLGAPAEDGPPVERLTLGRRSYHQVSVRAKTWREAATITEADGSTVFKAAEMLADGTLVGTLQARGPSRRIAELRVNPDGSWNSVLRYGKRGQDCIEASGQLRARDQPVRSQRTYTVGESLLWTAEATTEFDGTDDGGRPVARRTSGTVRFADGGSGTFSTSYYSVGTKGWESDASWTRVPGLGPTQTGIRKVTPIPGGGEGVEHIVDHTTGIRKIDKWSFQDKDVPGGREYVESESHTTISASGKASETSVTEHVKVEPGGTHWTRTTAHVDGTHTVERGEFTHGAESQSVSKSIVHSDGSTTIETTTWDTKTWTGQQHTVVTGPNGETISDTTTHGKMNITNTHHRPGDIGPIYTPDPPKQESDDTDDSNDSGNDTDDTNTDDDDTEDGDDAGGDTEEEHGGDSGDDETETSDDGFGGGGAGEYPGLGWDAGDSGPLALLPAMAAAGIGLYDDVNEPIDTLGDDSALASVLAQVIKDAVTGEDSNGLGRDTGDPLHGVSQSQLAEALRGMKPVDPDWRDWRNPKAHAAFLRQLTAQGDRLRVETSTLVIGTSLTQNF